MATTRENNSRKSSGATASPRKTARTSSNDPGAAGAYRVTVPVDRLDEAVVDTAVALARTPITLAKRVAPAGRGLPVYLGLGGLAVLGAVEWPVAAAAGVGFAALRRWGPLHESSSD